MSINIDNLSFKIVYSINEDLIQIISIEKAKNVNDYEVTNEGVQILTIDSCQYVWCKNGYGAGITHKGNCKYCAVRAKNNCH